MAKMTKAKKMPKESASVVFPMSKKAKKPMAGKKAKAAKKGY